jgi:ribonuclease P protein component
MTAFMWIKKRSQYQRVRATKKSAVTKFFIIQHADALDGEEVASFGITVSKKVSKKAVVRNRIKRQCREMIRSLCKNQTLSPRHYVIIARTASQNAKFWDMYQVFEKIIPSLHE